MDSDKFIKKCKELVKNYTDEHIDKSDNIPVFDRLVEGGFRRLVRK